MSDTVLPAASSRSGRDSSISFRLIRPIGSDRTPTIRWNASGSTSLSQTAFARSIAGSLILSYESLRRSNEFGSGDTVAKTFQNRFVHEDSRLQSWKPL